MVLKNDISSVCFYRTYPFLPTFTRYRSGKKIQSCHKMRMPRPYICLKKSMETQEQKFTRELANSRMQIELLRNQVLLRYYAQLLELDIMLANTPPKTLPRLLPSLTKSNRRQTGKKRQQTQLHTKEKKPKLLNRKKYRIRLSQNPPHIRRSNRHTSHQ